MIVNQEKIFYTKVHALVGIAIGVTALTCLCLLPHQTIIIEETITKFIIISFTVITLFLAGAMIFLPDSSILNDRYSNKAISSNFFNGIFIFYNHHIIEELTRFDLSNLFYLPRN